MDKLLLISAIAIAGMFLFAYSGETQAEATGRAAKPSPLEGAWELVSGQPLPPGVRDLKIISGRHFMFAAYDASGKPLYSAGGTYALNGTSYTEHMDFATEPISALIGKNQAFTVTIDGDTFTQNGTLSSGKPLSEVWKRINEK